MLSKTKCQVQLGRNFILVKELLKYCENVEEIMFLFSPLDTSEREN